MSKNFDRDEIIAKIEASKPLTRAEERFYMLHVLNFPKRLVDNIFAVADNKNPNVIVD